MAILLALAAALMYGVSDYVGGRSSRISPAILVTLVAEIATLIGVVVVLPLLGDPVPAVDDLLWGALAGVAGVVGILSLYRGLADGTMSVVAPITAVVAAVIPVTVGLLDGERPGTLAMVGIVAAIPAVALVSGAIGQPHRRTPPRILGLALVAGAGFGSLFVLLDRTSDESGLWPLAAARATSLPALLVAAALAARTWPAAPMQRALPAGVVIGLLTLGANAGYLVATREGLLSVVAVVVSMYPASTVLLATTLDGERIRGPQVGGLLLAATALVLVAV